MKTKNKLIVFLSCFSMLLFVGGFHLAQAQWEQDVAGNSDIPDLSKEVYTQDQKEKAIEATKTTGSGVTALDNGSSKKSSSSNSSSSSSSDSGVKALGEIYIPSDSGLPNNTVSGVLTNLLTWLLGIIGILGLIGFVVSGIQYLIASTSTEMAESAKKNATFSIVGIIVALSGFIIIQAINAALQGNSFF
jgi:hypothetical protein